MFFRLIPVLFLLTLAFSAHAEDNNKQARQCPDGAKLETICHAVNAMMNDNQPQSNYTFLYQRKIYEASCADIVNDSDEYIAQKVGLMWSQYEKDLNCNISDGSAEKRSILKLAVAKRFRSFIEEAAMLWKVNLNKVDEADGATVLDYVDKEIKRYAGTPNETILQQYYKTLRKSGAKHKSEL